MEQKMEDTARELMESDPTVKGVACSDETGAALFYRGTLNARHAAFASQIAGNFFIIESLTSDHRRSSFL